MPVGAALTAQNGFGLHGRHLAIPAKVHDCIQNSNALVTLTTTK